MYNFLYNINYLDFLREIKIINYKIIININIDLSNNKIFFNK